jgi:Ca2+-binding RTX toxin-like protein
MISSRRSMPVAAVLTALAVTSLGVVASPAGWADPGGAPARTASSGELTSASGRDTGVLTRAASATATLVRVTDLSRWSPPSPDPTGITYLSDADRLLISDSEVNEMPLYQGVNLWQVSRDGSQQLDTGTTVGVSGEPTGVSYDAVGRRVFVSDDDKDRVFEVRAGGDTRYGTADDQVTSFSTAAFGDDDTEDVAYDSRTGELFVTQANAHLIWRVSPGANGVFDGIAPTGDDSASRFDVGPYGSVDVEGLAYYGVRDSLFLADRQLGQILEVSTTGALLQAIDVQHIGMRAPSGITLAPASNDASRTSIYVVARGLDNNTYPNENDGRMFELAGGDLGAIVGTPNQAPSVRAGPDKTVVLPGSAVLDGTVSDDGKPNPPGAVTSTWTQVSGPGTVTFSKPKAVDTSADFSKPGTYVLRLSASDSALSVSDEVTVEAIGSASSVSSRCQGANALLQIGPGSNDVLRGTDGVDLIQGGRGNDKLSGRGGADCLAGGAGKDRLSGQGGNDVLVGNGGADVLIGGGGNDRIRPGRGRDKVDAGGGNDTVNSADGKRDVVACGSGRDQVVADAHDKVADSCERVRVRRSRS